MQNLRSLTRLTSLRKLKNIIPACTTACVCADVPDAMLVKAHAASNCNAGLKTENEISTIHRI